MQATAPEQVTPAGVRPPPGGYARRAAERFAVATTTRDGGLTQANALARFRQGGMPDVARTFDAGHEGLVTPDDIRDDRPARKAAQFRPESGCAPGNRIARRTADIRRLPSPCRRRPAAAACPDTDALARTVPGFRTLETAS